jgi:plastocyanin
MVLIYITSVATENQSSSLGQQLSSSSFSLAEGSSQPIASNGSNFESARITNTGISTTTTTNNNTSSPTTTTRQESGNLTQTVSSVAPPTNRTFYLENLEIETINTTKFGIPSDVFSLTQIAARQGDTVTINFYNLQKPGTSKHSFIIHDGSYNIDRELDPQQNTTITFKATQAGVFQYFCKYHPPSMTGQLIVLP